MTAYKINCGTSQTNPKLLSNEVAMTETSATPRNSKRAADADAPRETIRTSTTLGFTRRRFCSVTAATVSVGLLDPRGFCRRDKAMTNGIAGIKQETGRNTSGIRSFSVNVPEAELAELRRRINSTRWPDRETVTDESQGVPLATIQELTRYWGADYDWRKCEAKLNALPQFITEIDGLDIHFIHVRSKHENALPLIVTHGWPGSVIEQLKIIDPLTTRRSANHGFAGSIVMRFCACSSSASATPGHRSWALPPSLSSAAVNPVGARSSP